jgi:hypothetical protein
MLEHILSEKAFSNQITSSPPTAPVGEEEVRFLF